MVTSVSEAMTAKEFFDKCELTYSRIPVYKDNKDYIVGYVLKSAILELLVKDSFDTRLGDIVRPILSFDEDDNVFDIWEKMIEKKEHISVIQDKYGCLRGLVTMEDIIETMLGEEIVDEVDTETDLQKAALAKYESMQRSRP